MHTKLWAIQSKDNSFALVQLFDDDNRALIFKDKSSAEAYLNRQKLILDELNSKTITTSKWTWKGRVTTIEKVSHPRTTNFNDFKNAVVKEIILFL